MNPCKHMIDLLASYHRYLQALFYAKPTIERYLYEARDFVRYAGHHHKTGLISIQPKDLEAWEQSMVNSGRYQIKSIITRMRGLRAFFRFMVELEILPRDPFTGFVFPIPPITLPRDILTYAEVMRLIRISGGNSPVLFQNRLIIEVLYATGVRVSELCNLNIGDVDFSQGILRIQHGKGGKDRSVPLGPGTLTGIRQLLKYRKAVSEQLDSGNPLFLTIRGDRMRQFKVLDLVKRSCSTLAIQKNITPHALRHTCATHMLLRGAGIFQIKELLGHSDISTTQIYTRVAPYDMQRTHTAKHPRERYIRGLNRMWTHQLKSSLHFLDKNARVDTREPYHIRPAVFIC